MTHLLETDGISKYYGNVVALSDISAHVNAGEVTCILGDNGAGKSSFIKILSGCHQPDQGRLLVEGNPVQFTSPGCSILRQWTSIHPLQFSHYRRQALSTYLC